MLIVLVHLVLLFKIQTIVTVVQVPFIQNALLQSVNSVNTTITIYYNGSCYECLCYSTTAQIDFVGFNCYTNNNTCQFFLNSSSTIYSIISALQVKIYFQPSVFSDILNNQLENATKNQSCCMSNVTVLLQNLQGATSVKTSNITQPRCLIYDRVQNYIVTIEQKTNSTLKRFNATTLALIDQLSLGVSGNNLLFYDNSYFLSLANNSIMVYNSSTQSLIANIYHSSITSPRDMIFIQNFLIIANTGNAQLLFFQRYSSTNYTYLKQISTTAVNPHGLHYISDSLFYLTSWYNNEIYSFSQEQYFQFGPKSQWTSMTAILPWTQTLLVPNPNSTLHGGDHVTIDDCQRGWFSFQNFGLKVYNSSWTNIADWRYVTNIFDMIFLDNYVMIMSDDNQNRLIRIDPAMAC